MNSIIRFTGTVNKVSCANPFDCVEEIQAALSDASTLESDIIVFPKLALCSPSCGNLFLSTTLLEQCEAALEQLLHDSAQIPSYIIVGLAMDDYGKPVSAMAVLYRGELIGLIPTLDSPAPFAGSGFSHRLLPPETLFGCGSMRFCIHAGGLTSLALRAAQAAKTGCDLIVVPAYAPMYAGLYDEICESAKTISRTVGCALAIVNGGVGDTSSPYLYKPFVAIYECGERLAALEGGYESFSCSADLDADIIHARKKYSTGMPPVHAIAPLSPRKGLLRDVAVCPWVPAENRAPYLRELYGMQVRSLAARLENSGISKLVVGVSGGLDSTAALLASTGAVDVLGLPRKNIIGITMPGFGTSDRTYYNAMALLDALGVTRRDVSIRESVQLHLEDIGHTGKRDTTYENAQARERAQILLDVANTVSGLVVGAGDLSEGALGFCTFAGDQIANYNVNICIPKTVLRMLIGWIADMKIIPDIDKTLRDILDTPVSPELLPPTENGEIKQKTEEILGPYELHDFFTYYYAKYSFRPAKLYYYACAAFEGMFEPAFIKDKLGLFLRRYCAAQFKRACAPDAASITEVNLNGINHHIPSDLDPSALLRELEQLE